MPAKSLLNPADNDISRDLFHCCSLRAYVEIATETGQWPPDSEVTRCRAYELYERALTQKHRDERS
jgi:hypothetical protein